MFIGIYCINQLNETGNPQFIQDKPVKKFSGCVKPFHIFPKRSADGELPRILNVLPWRGSLAKGRK